MHAKKSARRKLPTKKKTAPRSYAKALGRRPKKQVSPGSRQRKTTAPGRASASASEVTRIQTLLLAKTPDGIAIALSLLKALRGTIADYETIFSASVIRAVACDNALSEPLVARWEVLIAALRPFPAVFNQFKQVAAGGLAKLRGNAGLPGLSRISDVAAELLAAFGGNSLDLGLKRLSVGAAQALARYKGVLWLTNLKTLSGVAAKALASSKGELFFGGLIALSDDAAKELSRFRGNTLSFYGLTKLSDKAAEALAKHVGRLDLNGLERLSTRAAQALARHSGPLDLSGLSELADRAASALNGNRSISLPREFRFEQAPVGSDGGSAEWGMPQTPEQAIEALKALRLYKPAPFDEIFGDDPTWFFDGLFGTAAPVKLDSYSVTCTSSARIFQMAVARP